MSIDISAIKKGDQVFVEPNEDEKFTEGWCLVLEIDESQHSDRTIYTRFGWIYPGQITDHKPTPKEDAEFQAGEMNSDLIVPVGKTKVSVRDKTYQSQVNIDDIGYIDGYLTAADSKPYGVFVRLSDGLIDFVSTHSVRAVK